jgi:hypothetical protein
LIKRCRQFSKISLEKHAASNIPLIENIKPERARNKTEIRRSHRSKIDIQEHIIKPVKFRVKNEAYQ